MTETFAALLFAHALADFVLQPGWMVRRKAEARMLIAHAGIVAATAWAATGFPLHPAIAVLAALHLATDALKVWVLGDRLGGFLADQALHLAALAGIALWQPGLYAAGIWEAAAAPPHQVAVAIALLPEAMAYGAGAILATLAGGHAIGKLLAPFLAARPALTDGSLEDAGRIIGLLERGVAFFLVVVGQPAGVGFLIAAKSVLRFSAAQDDRRVSEYVIIGTLASVGWALAAAYGALALAALLP
jgi:hypothetical protein